MTVRWDNNTGKPNWIPGNILKSVELNNTIQYAITPIGCAVAWCPSINQSLINDLHTNTGYTALSNTSVNHSTSWANTMSRGTIGLRKTGTSSDTYGIYCTSVLGYDFTARQYRTILWLQDLTNYLKEFNCIVLKIGTDNSNYYYKNFNRSEFTNGFNVLTMTFNDKSGTVGSPTITNINYAEIEFHAPNPSSVWSDYWYIRVDYITIIDQLHVNFLECNGQVINDVNSPYNGKTMPNLNNMISTYYGNQFNYHYGISGGGISNEVMGPINWSFETSSVSGYGTGDFGGERTPAHSHSVQVVSVSKSV